MLSINQVPTNLAVLLDAGKDIARSYLNLESPSIERPLASSTQYGIDMPIGTCALHLFDFRVMGARENWGMKSSEAEMLTSSDGNFLAKGIYLKGGKKIGYYATIKSE